VEFAGFWLGDEDLVSFEMALGEALANCVEHGGGPSLAVTCWRDDASLVAEIRHEGRGFEPPATVAAPPQGALRGYGLFIMHAVLDRIEFLEGGRGLRLSKRIR
jgi:anti-sigma regulatory factor (Ser/Thr protein kinase)